MRCPPTTRSRLARACREVLSKAQHVGQRPARDVPVDGLRRRVRTLVTIWAGPRGRSPKVRRARRLGRPNSPSSPRSSPVRQRPARADPGRRARRRPARRRRCARGRIPRRHRRRPAVVTFGGIGRTGPAPVEVITHRAARRCAASSVRTDGHCATHLVLRCIGPARRTAVVEHVRHGANRRAHGRPHSALQPVSGWTAFPVAVNCRARAIDALFELGRRAAVAESTGIRPAPARPDGDLRRPA